MEKTKKWEKILPTRGNRTTRKRAGDYQEKKKVKPVQKGV